MLGWSIALVVSVPLLAVGSLGAAAWFYWHGDLLRAIFWLIVGVTSCGVAVRLWDEVLKK